LIQGLPDRLTRTQLEQRLGTDLDSIGFVMSTWESVGILLFNREVTIDMTDHAFSGPISFSWRKLESYVQDMRRDLERETLLEWFQWLADRMKERETAGEPIPAYIQYRDWE
jgi:hypothetical protein